MVGAVLVVERGSNIGVTFSGKWSFISHKKTVDFSSESTKTTNLLFCGVKNANFGKICGF